MKIHALHYILIVFVGVVGISCKHIRKTETGNYDVPNFNAKDSSMVVWRNPDASPETFKNYLDSVAGTSNIVQNFCPNCDSSLVVISGAGVILNVVGQTASGGSRGGSGGPQGGDPLFYWSANFDINVNDSIYKYDRNAKPVELIDTSQYNEKPVVVAVFDTGVDSADLQSSGYLYANSNLSCLGAGADNGWNFVGKNGATKDNYNAPGHGAPVSKVILEQAQKIKKTPVKILPIKLFTPSGKATLYDVLCGIAYAKDRGANIVNASFGYYSCKPSPGVQDSAAFLFKEIIKKYLTENGILMIAAAGNQDDAQQQGNCPMLPITRDLDKINFYPASFATELKNVIAVTTVTAPGSASSVSPHQNYSPKVIDIGVVADSVNGNVYTFFDPITGTFLLEGSSYATPVVTGIISGHYNELKQQLAGAGFNKENIFDKLKTNGIIFDEPKLKTEIQKCRVATPKH